MAYQINLTGKEIDERLQNIGTAKDKAAADGTLYARINKNAVDISDHEKRLDALDNSGGASPTVAARLRLGVTWDNYLFRIHGKGLLPTDEVRLYRQVRGVSNWSNGDGSGRKSVKGWHEVKYLVREKMPVMVEPYLQAASDVTEDSPLKDEVEVRVRVPGFVPAAVASEYDAEEGYDDDLNYFFADFFLEAKDGALRIKHGRRGKMIVASTNNEYDATARTVEWAVMVLRDGKPITDFMPFKWLVETTSGITAPMNVREHLGAGNLKVSAVPFSHQLGIGNTSGSVELPSLNVVTGLDKVAAATDSMTLTVTKKNLKSNKASTDSVVFKAANVGQAGLMTAAMARQLEELYADYIQQKYSGQNVVVLEYDASRFAGNTAQFNGKTYDVSDGYCVLDLGEKKTINNTTADEQKFVAAITNVLFLPEGITNYDDAFRAGSANSNPFKVTAKVYMSQCTSAIRMFFNQKGLTELDVSYWDVSKMKTFSYMFALTGLKTLDVSRWDVSSAVSLDRVFSTTYFETLDTSKWRTPNCTNMACLFQTTDLLTIDLSSFDTSKVTDMHWMFYSWGVKNISSRDKEIIGLTRFDTSKVTNFSLMFAGLRNVTLDLSSFSLESAENVDAMFGVDKAVNTKQYVTLGEHFFNAPKLAALDLSPLKLSAELRQSLIDCFDRAAAGQQTLTLTLPTRTLTGVASLTDEEKAAIEAKGYVLK